MPEIDYVKWIGILGFTFLLSAIFFSQHSKIRTLEKEKSELSSELQQNKDALSYQNQAILNNMQDENKTKALPEVLHGIQTRYQTIYSTITQWRDSNVTNDCNSSMAYINNFKY